MRVQEPGTFLRPLRILRAAHTTLATKEVACPTEIPPTTPAPGGASGPKKRSGFRIWVPHFARRHLIRYYGAYSHRSRGARRAREEVEAEAGAASTKPDAEELPPTKSRASWARLLRRIYEVDPLLCPRCRGPLELSSVLVDPKVVDAILRHLDVTDQPTSVHARDPPAA